MDGGAEPLAALSPHASAVGGDVGRNHVLECVLDARESASFVLLDEAAISRDIRRQHSAQTTHHAILPTTLTWRLISTHEQIHQ